MGLEAHNSDLIDPWLIAAVVLCLGGVSKPFLITSIFLSLEEEWQDH